MNHEKTKRFLDLLERQALGEESAIGDLQSLEITQDDGQCLFNLYGEWRGAFSFFPGRLTALRPLLTLARWLVDGKRDNVNQKYARPEWASLVTLRGPVATVIIRKCNECDFESASMGTSGFYDANGLVCSRCGNVYFKSYYDESEMPGCTCGGRYREPQSNCKMGHHDIETFEISPYEYFATHSYLRGNDA